MVRDMRFFQKSFEIRVLPSAHHLKRTFDPDVTYEQIAWVLGKAHWKAIVKIVKTNYTESWTKFHVRRRHVATLSSLLMRFGKTSMRLGQPLVVLELLHAVRRYHSYTHMLHNICPLGRCVRMLVQVYLYAGRWVWTNTMALIQTC